MRTTVFQGFILFWFQPKRYLSLDRSITFQIHLGIHRSKIGLKLVYYYLYLLEASFTMNVCPHPFNRYFIILVQR